jgi:Ca2+-binding RTX toxin-like protein
MRRTFILLIAAACVAFGAPMAGAHEPHGPSCPNHEFNSATDFNIFRENDNPNNCDGTVGNDHFMLLGGSDEANGDDDRDIIDGGRGDDRLSGGAGGDNLIGRSGDDVLRGNRGDDDLRDNDGDGSDFDVFYDGQGPDEVFMGDGDGLDVWRKCPDGDKDALQSKDAGDEIVEDAAFC